MTLTLTRSERIHYKTLREELISAYSYSRNNSGKPSEAAALLIDAVGLDYAKDIVALMICCKGSWDGRISSRNRSWAETQMPDGEDIYRSDAGIYYCDEIHPSSLDMIATCLRQM